MDGTDGTCAGRSCFASAAECAAWDLLPLLEHADAKSLEMLSASFRALLLPAQKKMSLVSRLARQLSTLPFHFGEALMKRVPELPHEQLKEAVSLLKAVRPMRRQEQAARDTGLVPTDLDCWHLHSTDELVNLAAATRLCLQSERTAAARSLLLGVTLRAPESRLVDGPLVTKLVALEWVDGPAADPLQLSMCLVLGADGTLECDLEFVSGAWSEWAEAWSLQDGSLDASVSVVVPLSSSSGTILIKRPFGSQQVSCTFASSAARPVQSETVQAAEAPVVRALLQHVEAAGASGLQAVACVSRVRWPGDPPPWYPSEVARLVKDV